MENPQKSINTSPMNLMKKGKYQMYRWMGNVDTIKKNQLTELFDPEAKHSNMDSSSYDIEHTNKDAFQNKMESPLTGWSIFQLQKSIKQSNSGVLGEVKYLVRHNSSFFHTERTL